MDTEHTLSLITDYALGLLAAEERRRVEAHARLCPACRAALQREQRVGALLRDAARDVYKRQQYGTVGLSKFDELPVAFANDRVTIYRWQPAAP